MATNSCFPQFSPAHLVQWNQFPVMQQAGQRQQIHADPNIRSPRQSHYAERDETKTEYTGSDATVIMLTAAMGVNVSPAA